MLAESAGYLRLRRELLNGSYLPGQRMSSRGLARKLGITRPQVRTALRQMIKEGLLRAVPQSGVYLRRASREHTEHICQMREAIEPSAAKWAARRITPQQIRALQGICDQLREIELEFKASGRKYPSEETLRRISRLDLRFHLSVIRASGNPLAYRTIRNFQVLSTVFGVNRELPSKPEAVDLGAYCRWHTLMAQAIERGDGEFAKSLMEQHVAQATKRALGSFEGQDDAVSTRVKAQTD